MNIIKNAAGKWLIESTDAEVLWLDCKVNRYGCEACPWKDDEGCDGFDHATCMTPTFVISKVAERIQNENRKER